MAWSTIRRATSEDNEALEAAAVRFCRRHNIDTSFQGSAVASIDFETTLGFGASAQEEERAKHLERLWKRITKRILGNGAEGIAYGYIGYHID